LVFQCSDERVNGARVVMVAQRMRCLSARTYIARFQLPNEFVYSRHRSHHDY
jgi:hypothetical protein